MILLRLIHCDNFLVTCHAPFDGWIDYHNTINWSDQLQVMVGCTVQQDRVQQRTAIMARHSDDVWRHRSRRQHRRAINSLRIIYKNNIPLFTITVVGCWRRAFRSSSVPLTPVLEPVADLDARQSGQLRQVSLLSRRRIWVGRVPVAQCASRRLPETVRSLLAVPYRPRQREAATNAILADSAEWSATHLLGLGVVGAHPEGLQTRMVDRREWTTFQHRVDLFVETAMERDQSLRNEHTDTVRV